MCTALRFFAQGDHFSTISDATGLSIASTSRCLEAVTEAIYEVAHQFITFPEDDNDIRKVQLIY